MANSDVMFKISIGRISSIYDNFEQELVSEIDRMRALGISDKEIYRRISDNLDNGMDMFGSVKGAIEKEVDSLLGTTAQGESNEVFRELEQELKWELDPTARQHCNDCLRLSASPPKKFEQWEAMGLPGFGNTECGQYCKCSLVQA